jgi:hypothetical protein
MPKATVSTAIAGVTCAGGRERRARLIMAVTTARNPPPKSTAEVKSPAVSPAARGSRAPAVTTVSTAAGPRPPRRRPRTGPQPKVAIMETAPSTAQKTLISPGPNLWALRKATMNVTYAMYPAPNRVYPAIAGAMRRTARTRRPCPGPASGSGAFSEAGAAPARAAREATPRITHPQRQDAPVPGLATGGTIPADTTMPNPLPLK